MKKIKLFIVLAFCFAINLQAQTACDFSPGSIGAASETICYNGNPALIANSETNNAIALFNEELYGNHHDIIALPDNTWFTGNYTIESWVKPQKVLRYIITNGTSITTYGNQMIGNVFESYAGGLEGVSFAYGDIYTYTPKLTVCGSNGSSSITSSIAIPENQWSHLAVSFNGTTATMYINGQVVATGPMAVPTSVLRTYNRIGNGRSVGKFDEVRIWNVSRTAEEIMATMNVPLIGTELGLMAYYDCNQGTANVNNASITTLIDKSPNNKNATLGNQFYMFGDQSNFTNGSPATINANGGSGTFTYKWQANGVDIANSNSASYDPPSGLTNTTTYTRFAKEGTCDTFKQSLGSRVVTVRENILSGEISSTGESICNNGDPAEIGSTTAASGGDGAITYKWQANGVDIANSNTASYDPPAGLTATTTYTRFAKEGTCNTSFTPSSGNYVVTVRENFLSGEISSAGESICNNGNSAVISSTTAASGGDGAFTYKWQANGIDIANSDSDSYDPPTGLTATTTYTRFAKDAGCSTTFSQSSGSYVVTVRGSFSTGEISSVGETICNNGDPAEIGSTTAASGGDGSITYKWQANGVDIDDSNSASYDQPAGLTATTTYTRFAKEGTCNTSFTPSSGSYVVTVRGNFSSGEISSTGESICNNGDPAVISSTTAASSSEGAISYKWQANGVDIANSDSDSYDPPSGLTTTTTFTRFAKDGTCNTSFTPSSESYMVTVNPNLTSSVNIVADNAVYPNAIAITASAVNGGTSPIYQWYNGTTAVGTNSATYTTTTLTLGQSLAIKVVMTSNATPCLTGSTTTSNIIHIAAPIVPSVRLVSAGIGVASTAMNPSAQLEVKSDTKGFLPPRMTATERDAIASPVTGLMLYCSNCGANGELEVYNGATWTNLGGSAAAAIVGSATATSIVSDPTNFNIKINTVVAVDQLDITPSADFSLNTGIARNTTATNLITNAAISRYYKFGATTNAFSGILKINYDETELNGLTESNLKILYHNGTIWNSDVNSSNNATNNFVQSSSLSSVALNEVTTGIGEIPTGPLSFCAGAKVAAAVGSTSLKFYTASKGGSPLSGTTALATKTYYVTETTNSGPSARVPVAVTVNALPVTPSVLELKSGSEVIKKVGNFIGTSTELKLIATAAAGTVATATYNWVLPTTPTGVTQKAGEAIHGAEITVNFVGVAAGNTAIDFLVSSVSDAGCVSKTAKKLTVTRSEPGKPKGLVLTDATDAKPATTEPVAAAVLPIVVKKLDAYTGALKNRTLTLTVTPEIKAGSQASSYKWVLPAAATTDATHFQALDANEVLVDVPNMYTSTNSSINITLGEITTETEFLFKVNGVNKNGTSLLSKDLTLKSAAAKTPGAITSSSPKFYPNCSATPTLTVQVPSVLGVTYAWKVGGVSVSSSTNSIVISTAGVTSTTLDIEVTASNGYGASTAKTLSIKKGTTTCATVRMAPEAAIATEAFKAMAYPNPSSTNFNLNITTSSAKNVEVKVYDMIGKLINKMEVSPSKVVGLQIGDRYPFGVYNVIVSQGTEVKTLRVIKQ